MKRDYFVRLVSGALSPRPNTGFSADVALIRGGFADYLGGLGFSAFTIGQYQRRVMRVAHWLREHRHRLPLNKLRRGAVPRLLSDCLPSRASETVIGYRKALFRWLRFQERYAKPVRLPLWQPWIEDYINFLRMHRGVGASTIEHSVSTACDFLRWRFGRGHADWSRVQASDIWGFARSCARGARPIYAKARLGHLRGFLAFANLRGACPWELITAVPKIAVPGHSTRPQILSERQQRELRASFRRTSPEGKRDYAMTLCMLDLGLRGCEVIGLRLQDIDWQERRLHIPATKTGQGRLLPIPRRIFAALRDYVENGRPPAEAFDHVFVRHPRRIGHPLSRSALKAMISRAYQRCRFPKSWSGTHRLRHTFASRLYKRGAQMKSLADLLGHRCLNSTNDYTQIDPQVLRSLAQPWPC